MAQLSRHLLLIAAWSACTVEPAAEDPPAETEQVPDLPRTTDPTRPLTAAEFRNTVAAVFGEPVGADLWLPPDSIVDGFDNQIGGSTMSSSRLAGYDAAIALMVDRVISPPAVASLHEDLDGASPFTPGGGPSSWSGSLLVPTDGTYTFTVQAAFAADSPLFEVILAVDGVKVATLVWSDPVVDPEVSVDLRLGHGYRFVTLQAYEGSLVPGVEVARYDSLGPVRVDGPIDAPEGGSLRDRVVTCDLVGDTEACVRRVLGQRAPMGWRRPVSDAELDELVAVATGTLALGGSPDEALGDALHAMLLSPNMLLHLERTPEIIATWGPSWAVASRLSYFLWSGPPDEVLSARAAAGELMSPEVVAEEVRRMRANPRARALISGYANQWLELDRIDTVDRSEGVFPGFSTDLSAMMREQLDRYVERFLLGDDDMLGLLDDPQAWVDPTLAEWIGAALPGAQAAEVDLAPLGRFGILGLPAVQTMLAAPDRTSPTFRGVWILKHLLCDPPGAPPAAVPALAQSSEADPRPLTDLLAQHVADPACASCHKVIDPPGMTMEHFNAVGQWRADDHGHELLTRGTLPDGTVLDGLPDLVAWLRADERSERCFAQMAASWALGRVPEEADLDRIGEAWRAGGRSFGALAEAIATDPSFLQGPVAP